MQESASSNTLPYKRKNNYMKELQVKMMDVCLFPGCYICSCGHIKSYKVTFVIIDKVWNS